MCSSDEINGVMMRKRFGDVRPKKKARSTGRKPPTSYIYVRKESASEVAIASRFVFTNVRITIIARNSRMEKKTHHLGRTTEGHTLRHHGVLPAFYQ